MCLSAYASKVGNCPNIHKKPSARITIAQTLPELQGYALHVPDQVIFQEQTTLSHHNIKVFDKVSDPFRTESDSIS
jgi:hypothetical protein